MRAARVGRVIGIDDNPVRDRVLDREVRAVTAEATTTALEAWARAHPDQAREPRARIAA